MKTTKELKTELKAGKNRAKKAIQKKTLLERYCSVRNYREEVRAQRGKS